MADDCPTIAAPVTDPVSSLAERVAFFRVLFSRHRIGCTPTVAIRIALDSAARLAARAEAAELNPNSDASTVANLRREYRFAKRDLDKLIAARPRPKSASPMPGLLSLHSRPGKAVDAPSKEPC